jgi:hypothetical protein
MEMEDRGSCATERVTTMSDSRSIRVACTASHPRSDGIDVADCSRFKVQDRPGVWQSDPSQRPDDVNKPCAARADVVIYFASDNDRISADRRRRGRWAGR